MRPSRNEWLLPCRVALHLESGSMNLPYIYYERTNACFVSLCDAMKIIEMELAMANKAFAHFDHFSWRWYF